MWYLTVNATATATATVARRPPLAAAAETNRSAIPAKIRGNVNISCRSPLAPAIISR
jgi:hypothetical protein